MKPNFEKGEGLLPAVVQDANTHKVLMLGYLNEEALAETQKTGKVTFYSRSKGRLWTKGETSGNFLNLRSIELDCDDDTFLIKVDPVGPACHTGADTCFGEENKDRHWFIQHLEQIITDRKSNPGDTSYTSSLFQKGINKVAQKVGEEAVELVIEAKDDDDDLFLNEAADLLFHYLVLLEAKELPLDRVLEILQDRHSKKK